MTYDFVNDWTAWKPDSWQVTIDRFLGLGISEERLGEAAKITFSRGREAYWRYFCGIVWNWIEADKSPTSGPGQ
jgi:hypothetical protein